MTETVLDRRLMPLEHTAVDVALASTVRNAEVPLLPMVVDWLLNRDARDDAEGRLAEDGRLVGHALRRLVGGTWRASSTARRPFGSTRRCR